MTRPAAGQNFIEDFIAVGICGFWGLASLSQLGAKGDIVKLENCNGNCASRMQCGSNFFLNFFAIKGQSDARTVRDAFLVRPGSLKTPKFRTGCRRMARESAQVLPIKGPGDAIFP